VVALATLSIDTIRQKYGQRARMLAPAVFALALPSNLLLIFIQLMGVMAHAPALYLRRGKPAPLPGSGRDARPGNGLAAPDMGGFIPAFTAPGDLRASF